MRLDKLPGAIYGHFETVDGYARMDRHTGITKLIIFRSEAGQSTLHYFLDELKAFIAEVDREIENEAR